MPKPNDRERANRLRALAHVHADRGDHDGAAELRQAAEAIDRTPDDQDAADLAGYRARALPRLARLDALAPAAAFHKMPGQRTSAEQAAWDEHAALLSQQAEDEYWTGL